jgi:hypothetical protein
MVCVLYPGRGKGFFSVARVWGLAQTMECGIFCTGYFVLKFVHQMVFYY